MSGIGKVPCHVGTLRWRNGMSGFAVSARRLAACPALAVIRLPGDSLFPDRLSTGLTTIHRWRNKFWRLGQLSFAPLPPGMGTATAGDTQG